MRDLSYFVIPNLFRDKCDASPNRGFVTTLILNQVRDGGAVECAF